MDRGEGTGLMEPMKIGPGSRHFIELADLAMELARKSEGFRRSMPDGTVEALSDLVRSMNCYYSNLIEGHDIHPVDIEKALNNDYSDDAQKRDLQLEAKAHIEVQRWIDDGNLSGRAATAAGISEVHSRFCEQLPDEFLWVENPDTGERVRVIPGEFRERDAKVGKHMPISPGAVPRFLQHFENTYARLSGIELLVSLAASHHRLVWVHPFADGNGRVVRLMSHALLLDSLETGGVWSVARGLARATREYRQHLQNCDAERHGDVDGRGNLSESALAEFSKFFLQTCIDQVEFMESLVRPDKLLPRILDWANSQIASGHLPKQSTSLLEAIVYRGQIRRSEIPELLQLAPRSSRRVASELLQTGILVSETSRSPLRLSLPASLATVLMPGLFPEKIQ
jgi:Fic family protein